MYWDKLIYVVVREAANLYYSRLKVRANQTQAKAEMTYLIREARHMGMAMGLDTLKYTSIDIDIRAVTDYLIFKAQIMDLTSGLNWLYGHMKPHNTRHMKQNSSYSVAKQYQTPHKRKQKTVKTTKKP